MNRIRRVGRPPMSGLFRIDEAREPVQPNKRAFSGRADCTSVLYWSSLAARRQNWNYSTPAMWALRDYGAKAKSAVPAIL
jgi:hypothetical protein